MEYQNGDDANSEPAYTVTVIDRKRGKVKERKYPAYAGFSVFSYGLRTVGNDKIAPFVVMKGKDKVIVRVFDVNN